MRRTDSLKILFVCVCVCTVCPAHPCGDNPLLVVEHFSKTRGLRSDNFMVSLRQSEPEIYHQLMGEYQDYMECTRAVQTGYYKRSVDNTAKYHLDTYSLDPYGKSIPKTQVITNLLKGAVQQTMEQQHQHQQQQKQQQNQNSNTLWKKINDAVSSSILSPATSDVSNIGGSITQTGEKDLPILIKRLLGRSLEMPSQTFDYGSGLEDVYQDV